MLKNEMEVWGCFSKSSFRWVSGEFLCIPTPTTIKRGQEWTWLVGKLSRRVFNKWRYYAAGGGGPEALEGEGCWVKPYGYWSLMPPSPRQPRPDPGEGLTSGKKQCLGYSAVSWTSSTKLSVCTDPGVFENIKNMHLGSSNLVLQWSEGNSI